jgi:hypothetical protein
LEIVQSGGLGQVGAQSLDRSPSVLRLVEQLIVGRSSGTGLGARQRLNCSRRL